MWYISMRRKQFFADLSSMLWCPVETVCSQVVNPLVLPADCGAVLQQTVRILPEVHIRALCESLRGAQRSLRPRTAAPEQPLWGTRCAHSPDLRLLLLLGAAQLRVAKRPNHPAEIHEESAHDQDHECIGLYHGFGDRRSHVGTRSEK